MLIRSSMCLSLHRFEADYAPEIIPARPRLRGNFEVAALRPMPFCCSEGLYAHIRRSTIFRG